MGRKKSFFKNVQFTKRELIDLVIFILFIYILIPQFGKFRQSIKLLKHINWGWVDLSVVITLLTVFSATAVYNFLAKKRLHFWRTFVVQAASLFTNRLLPAGIGSLGINYEYLRRYKHSQAEASAVVASSSLVGIAGHLALLSIILATTNTSLSQILSSKSIKPEDFLLALGVLIAFSIFLMWAKKIRHNIFKTMASTLKNIRGYRTHPLKLAGAMASSMSLTLLYTFALLACVHALGASLTFGNCLIVLTAGVIGSTITPTPGGLVGAEAGFFAGLIVYKINSAEALAIVLLYRLITYWLLLIFGIFALFAAESLNYV